MKDDALFLPDCVVRPLCTFKHFLGLLLYTATVPQLHMHNNRQTWKERSACLCSVINAGKNGNKQKMWDEYWAGFGFEQHMPIVVFKCIN